MLVLSKRIKEKEAVALACFAINDGKIYITSQVKNKIIDLVKPIGLDSIPYNHRSDKAIAQKIGNIISHNNKEAFKLMDINKNNVKNEQTEWKINKLGLKFLDTNKQAFEKIKISNDYDEIVSILRKEIIWI